MKNNELCIGNIVRIKDTGEIVSVCDITKHKVGFHAPNERPNAHLRYRRLHEVDGEMIYDHKDKINCPELKWVDDLRICIFRGFHVLFIHELQNIYYAFIGEELKIEL